jgi:hypothetical protein
LKSKLDAILPIVDVQEQTLELSTKALVEVAKKLHLAIPIDFERIILGEMATILNKYYKTGEIKLNPVNITRTVVGSEIQVEAVPESNDVIALRDIYLDLNIQNTVVNMIEDTISSGENLSASSYAVTSSYSNGNYIR